MYNILPMMKERKQIRISLPLCVKYKFEGQEQLETGTTEDLSWGGVFLRAAPLPAKGKRIMIEFEIPGENMIMDLWGTVVRVREEPGKPPGVGILFDDLDQDARGQIQNLVNYWVHYLVNKMKK